MGMDGMRMNILRVMDGIFHGHDTVDAGNGVKLKSGQRYVDQDGHEVIMQFFSSRDGGKERIVVLYSCNQNWNVSITGSVLDDEFISKRKFIHVRAFKSRKMNRLYRKLKRRNG